jgi:hypothetical protein
LAIAAELASATASESVTPKSFMSSSQGCDPNLPGAARTCPKIGPLDGARSVRYPNIVLISYEASSIIMYVKRTDVRNVKDSDREE